MKIRGCHLKDFIPFTEQKIELQPSGDNDSKAEIHFVTGINGSGKTRFLCALEAAFGNSSDLDARVTKRPHLKVWAEHQNWSYRWSNHGKFFKRPLSIETIPPELFQNNNQGDTDLVALAANNPHKYPHNLALRDEVLILSFRGSLRISDCEIQAQAPVDLGKRTEHISFDKRPQNEHRIISQAIANIVSMGSQEIMQEIPNGRYGKILKGVNRVLRQFLNKKTAFFVDSRGKKISLQVLLESERIELNHLPDGLRSIIAWLFATIAKLEVAYPAEADPLSCEFIMLLDEPETHLHPAWQRYVLRIAQELFPNAQFIVATHSPFIISSINEGWIHILTPTKDGSIHFEKPLKCSEGDTYMDAVEDVLGISELYDPETEELLEEFREQRKKVVSNDFKGEDDLKALMQKIGSRSRSLENMMGRELYQLDKAKQMKASA